MKYRLKTKPCEARQLTEDNFIDVVRWVNSVLLPESKAIAILRSRFSVAIRTFSDGVTTFHEDAGLGDWIVKISPDTFAVEKNSCFRKRYEKVQQ